MGDRLLLTVAEAADSTRMSQGWIKQAIRSGELPSAKFGRAVRIRVQDLEAFIRSKIVGTAEYPGGAPGVGVAMEVLEKITGDHR